MSFNSNPFRQPERRDSQTPSRPGSTSMEGDLLDDGDSVSSLNTLADQKAPKPNQHSRVLPVQQTKPGDLS